MDINTDDSNIYVKSEILNVVLRGILANCTDLIRIVLFLSRKKAKIQNVPISQKEEESKMKRFWRT